MKMFGAAEILGRTKTGEVLMMCDQSGDGRWCDL